jgi:hypothetical protein
MERRVQVRGTSRQIMLLDVQLRLNSVFGACSPRAIDTNIRDLVSFAVGKFWR